MKKINLLVLAVSLAWAVAALAQSTTNPNVNSHKLYPPITLTDTTTGSEKAFSSIMTGNGNTGYAGYLSNTATTGYALYVNGNCLGCSQINALYYTTTSKTVLASDVNNLITFNNAVAGSWNVPNAGSAGFNAPNSAVYISNMGAGALAISSTSGGSVFNGLGATTTYSLTQNQWSFCVPDVTNNYDCISNAISSGLINTSTSGYVAYYANTGSSLSGTNALRVSSTGWVGIGTASPSAPLEVNGGGLATVFQIDSSFSNGADFIINSTATNGHNIQLSSYPTATPGAELVIYDGTSNNAPLSVSGAAHVVAATNNLIYGWVNNANFSDGAVLDTGISRDSAGVIDIGTGAQGNKAGSVNLTTLTASATIKTGGYTVGTLPSGTVGMRAYVTDQTTACPVVGGVLTGSGGITCPVFYNGSAWVGD